jgi:hypothetical protein
MKNDPIWSKKSPDITPGGYPNESKINLLVFGREGVDRAVHIELETILHEKVVRYSTVAKYFRSASFGERGTVQANSDNAPNADPVDQAILQALAFQPFASICQISRMILLSKSTVCRHLIESLGFISQRLRWVPYRLSEELLQLLLSMKHQSWKFIMTLNETWFHFCTDYETI